MDINELNKRITACRMLNEELRQEYNTTQPIVHEGLLKDVIEHRKYFGVIPRFTLMRAWVKTRKYCKTIKL